MSKLPIDLSGPEIVKAFQKEGWVIRKWSAHIILEKKGTRPILSVPNHRIVKPGTLRALIRTSGITLEKFLDLL